MAEPTESELQEAASCRFGGGTLMLQVLASGSWVIRGDDWELLAVLDPAGLSMTDFAEVVREFALKGRGRYAKEKALGADGRMRSSFEISGTVTGRADQTAEDLGL